MIYCLSAEGYYSAKCIGGEEHRGRTQQHSWVECHLFYYSNITYWDTSICMLYKIIYKKPCWGVSAEKKSLIWQRPVSAILTDLRLWTSQTQNLIQGFLWWCVHNPVGDKIIIIPKKVIRLFSHIFRFRLPSKIELFHPLASGRRCRRRTWLRGR